MSKEHYKHRMNPSGVPRHAHQWQRTPMNRKKCLICGKVKSAFPRKNKWSLEI